jgi:hypothetical protein
MQQRTKTTMFSDYGAWFGLDLECMTKNSLNTQSINQSERIHHQSHQTCCPIGATQTQN